VSFASLQRLSRCGSRRSRRSPRRVAGNFVESIEVRWPARRGGYWTGHVIYADFYFRCKITEGIPRAIMILLFKLATAPILILALTLLTRRFGPAFGGLAMGIPLVTGPISVFTAIEQGPAFAAQAAVGNLVGQVSTCLFCFAYARTAALGHWVSAIFGVVAFFSATALWQLIDWTLPTAIALLVIGLLVLAKAIKAASGMKLVRLAPRWDLPLRMFIASAFVLTITGATRHLGPQLSGLVAPFPVFVLILAVFTHMHHGSTAAAAMMRGVILGSLSFASFFVVVAMGLRSHAIGSTYAAGIFASVTCSGLVYLFLHRPSRLWPWAPPVG